MPIDPRVALAAACRRCSRRSLLGAGAAGLAALAMPRAARAVAPTALDARISAAEFGDVPLPLPIHELDKNHHHNVPPGPYTEPSEILNFRGTVATAVLVGTARDQTGRKLSLGGAGTDVRFMSGEYRTADGATHRGTFTHL